MGPAPFPALGAGAAALARDTGLRLATLADREERLTGRPALLGPVLSALTSHSILTTNRPQSLTGREVGQGLEQLAF